MYINEIAAEIGMSYDYTKRRLKTLREEITLEVVDRIEMNCGEDIYSVGLHTFQEIAKEAGAVYHIKRRVLVNTKIVDQLFL